MNISHVFIHQPPSCGGLPELEDAGAGAHQVAHGAAAAHQVVPEAAEEAAESVVVLLLLSREHYSDVDSGLLPPSIFNP